MSAGTQRCQAGKPRNCAHRQRRELRLARLANVALFMWALDTVPHVLRGATSSASAPATTNPFGKLLQPHFFSWWVARVCLVVCGLCCFPYGLEQRWSAAQHPLCAHFMCSENSNQLLFGVFISIFILFFMILCRCVKFRLIKTLRRCWYDVIIFHLRVNSFLRTTEERQHLWW